MENASNDIPETITKAKSPESARVSSRASIFMNSISKHSAGLFLIYQVIYIGGCRGIIQMSK